MSDAERPRSGTMRVYLGAAPGVGKTCAMLAEGRRRRERGADVVVGYVESHGREFTAAQVGGLEVVPRRVLVHRDSTFEEMDVDAIIARAPRIALVDELAHTNVPGSRNSKRWQDIEALLAAGIDVISTVNIQHLESMNDVVEKITGVRQQETVPDSFVRGAEQIELVDMTPEALRRRMAHGNVYPSQRVDAALANYFRPGNLAALRELALLWVADRVEDGLRAYMARHDIDHPWETRERVLVAISGAPGGDHVIRRAARMAGRSARDLVGVFVSSSDGLARRVGPQLDAQRTLLAELGGRYVEVVGTDIARTLVDVARDQRATQLVLGASRRSDTHERWGGSIVAAVLRAAGELDVHVISARVLADEEQNRRGRRRLRRAHTPLSARRRTTAILLALFGLPVATVILKAIGDSIQLESVLLIYLTLVIAVASIGGAVVGLGTAVIAFAVSNILFTQPTGSFTVDDSDDVVALVVFLAAASIVSTIVGVAARRAEEANRARAEAEALARSTASLAADADPLPDVLEQLRLALGAGAARLERRDQGDWRAVLSTDGRPVPNASPADAAPPRAEVGLDDDHRVVLLGGALTPDNRRLVTAFGNQLVAGLRARDLQHEADEAERLAAADELRTGILRAVSHDLRTPLATIKTSVTGLLADDVEWDAKDRDELLRAIDEEADRLNRIIENLLDMSRLEAGVLGVRLEAVALDDVVAAAVAGVEPSARDEVVVEVSPDLPPVLADATLLERVVANLVSNAIAASCGRAAVTIEASVLAPERIDLRVVDHGPGLLETEKAGVFEPFQRLDDRGGAKGLGLGLAIARRFVDAMGGELVLDDTPGGGVTATVTLQVSR